MLRIDPDSPSSLDGLYGELQSLPGELITPMMPPITRFSGGRAFGLSLLPLWESYNHSWKRGGNGPTPSH